MVNGLEWQTGVTGVYYSQVLILPDADEFSRFSVKGCESEGWLPFPLLAGLSPEVSFGPDIHPFMNPPRPDDDCFCGVPGTACGGRFWMCECMVDMCTRTGCTPASVGVSGALWVKDYLGSSFQPQNFRFPLKVCIGAREGLDWDSACAILPLSKLQKKTAASCASRARVAAFLQ